MRTPALAAGALAIASCAFHYSTIPQPFVRPGARVFYVKVARQTDTENSTYKGTSVVTTVQSTRYLAIDLGTCRKLGELPVKGQTWEQAWDPDGDDLWFAQDIGYTNARSFKGRQASLPKFAHPGVDRWTTAGALRLTSPGGAGPPSVWSFHTGASTPVPARVGGGAEVLSTSLFGASRLVGIEAPGAAPTIDVIVVDPAPDPGAPPIVARRSLGLENAYARPLGLVRGDRAILFGDGQSPAFELYDLDDGHRIRRTPLPPEGTIVGPSSGAFGFMGPLDRREGFPCDHTLTLDDLSGATARAVVFRDCLDAFAWIGGGPFAGGGTYTPGRQHPALFDTRSGSTFMLSHTARHPVSLGGALFFDDGTESKRRLYQVDFARGAATPVEGYVGDIRFVAADPVSGTLILTAGPDDVLVYRSSTGHIERCFRP